MTTQYPTLQGPPMRLRQRCAGSVLAHLVLAGHTVAVGAAALTSLPALLASAASTPPQPAATQ